MELSSYDSKHVRVKDKFGGDLLESRITMTPNIAWPSMVQRKMLLKSEKT